MLPCTMSHQDCVKWPRPSSNKELRMFNQLLLNNNLILKLWEDVHKFRFSYLWTVSINRYDNPIRGFYNSKIQFNNSILM